MTPPNPTPTPAAPFKFGTARGLLIILTGVLSTGLLGQGVLGVDSWDNNPITHETIWGLSVLPGFFSAVFYVRFLERQRRDHPTPSGWQRLSASLLTPLYWGLATAMAVGLQWAGVGVTLSVPAYLTPISNAPGLPAQDLPIPAPVFWAPLIAATLRVLSAQTLAPPMDHSARTLLRRSLTVLLLLTGTFLAVLSPDAPF